MKYEAQSLFLNFRTATITNTVRTAIINDENYHDDDYDADADADEGCGDDGATATAATIPTVKATTMMLHINNTDCMTIIAMRWMGAP